MPSDQRAEYYLVRKRASVAMSLLAEDPGVREIHLEFARRYAALAGESAEKTEDSLTMLEAKP